jgi:hypothetical protein
MFKPYEWQDPLHSREYQHRIQGVLDSVAGAATPPAAAESPSPQPTIEPARQSPAIKGKLKSGFVLAILKALPSRVADEVNVALIRDGVGDDAERADAVTAEVLELKQSTPANLARRLEQRGYLKSYNYTKKSLEQMIGRLLREGKLPGWTGGKSQKAVSGDGHKDHDVDAEFNPRRRRRLADHDESSATGMTIRNRLHTSATPSQKAARRGRRPSRDDVAIGKMSGISDEQAAEARAFYAQHPELKEG